MSTIKQKQAAKRFAQDWSGKGYEKGETQRFWLSLLHNVFGVLTSVVHNSWIRAVAGRLEMRYRYSKDIVNNNFPWPATTEEQKARIEQTAQGILQARQAYPEASFADLYGNLILFPELQKAHRANDAAVLEAYGFPKDASETEIVARLFKMYQELTK